MKQLTDEEFLDMLLAAHREKQLAIVKMARINSQMAKDCFMKNHERAIELCRQMHKTGGVEL